MYFINFNETENNLLCQYFIISLLIMAYPIMTFETEILKCIKEECPEFIWCFELLKSLVKMNKEGFGILNNEFS